MSDDPLDIFGANPNRPNHPDMRVLSDIILTQDGKTEDPAFDMGVHIAQTIEPAVLNYVAMQRALRIGMVHPDLADIQTRFALAGMYLDAFITGVEWQKRRS